MNSSKTNDWISLSDKQKNGILDAIDEIEAGSGIPHGNVIAKFRKKYTDVL